MLDYYQENEAVMKMIIEVIQNAIEALEFSLYPILETIVIRILEIYSNKKYYFILQFMEKLISIFGNNKTFSQGLFTSFESFAIATFNGLNCESKLNVKLLIEFYKLSSTTLKVLPMIFLKSPLILTLIELALEGCKIKNKEVNKSAMNFIMNIIDCKFFHQDIEACVINALTKYSRQIIYILIVSSAFVYDNSQMTDVAEILFAIKSKSDEGFKILLTETMNLIIMRKITTGQIFNHNSSLNLIIGSLTK
ncbi:hypothetical protein PVAND_012905 [Polypedilum vanderplanki]|uniref:Uncharacterized protein n=1 Tax=Polypedilum vanderplanki TaxID=319348 RepID=A0A9J6CN26_POLVA|nr:hypothetical protein PVAND_012905 [Polypedilum vanderplanki]